MVRYIAAGILGCLYLIVSFWIVSRQGEAYRDSLRQERHRGRPVRDRRRRARSSRS